MPKVAFVFPGQGAQFVGMGKEMYEASSASRQIFDQADQVIPHLTEVIFNGPPEELTLTAYCQPAIFTVSIACLKAIKAHPIFKNIQPSFACGLSLGEYSALAACGAMDFTATLRLVERRSFLMEEATKLQKGGMAAVIGFDKDRLFQICEENQIQIANYNSPEQIVITGEKERVEKASLLIKEAGAKRVIPLEVSGAFHSVLMEPAAAKFEEELSKINFRALEFSIISNVDALPSNNPIYIRKNLAKQITSPVRWVETIEYIARQGVTHFLEIGPGTVLKGLIRKINPSLSVYNILQPEDIEKLVLEESPR